MRNTSEKKFSADENWNCSEWKSKSSYLLRHVFPGIFWTTFLEAEAAGQQFLILGCSPQAFSQGIKLPYKDTLQ